MLLYDPLASDKLANKLPLALIVLDAVTGWLNSIVSLSNLAAIVALLAWISTLPAGPPDSLPILTKSVWLPFPKNKLPSGSIVI